MAKRSAPVVRLPAIELVAPLAMLALLATPFAHADVKVQPGIDVRETYSDNLTLSSDENTRGQFVTEVSPTVAAIINAPRLKLLARATGHLYAYSGERQANTNSSSLNLLGTAKATVVDDLLYADGSVNRSQQSISAFGPQQNGYSDANSDTVTTYSASPYLVHKFGAFATGQLRYTHDGVKAERNLLQNSTGDSLAMNLNSGPSFSRFGWGVQAYHQQLSDSQVQSKTDTALGTLRYNVRNNLSIYTTGGYDKYDYGDFGGVTQGKNYSGGFTWTPSQRTSIDASAGRRYFGKTYSLAASHRSRNTVFTSSYHDDVTTARAQFLQPGSVQTASLLDSSFAAAFPDPVERRQAIDAYILANGLPASVANNINYFSNRLFLQKQFQAAVVVNGSRSTAVLSVNNTKRLALTSAVADNGLPGTAVPNLNDNTHQRALTMTLNYRLSPRSAATLTATKSRSESLDTGIDSSQTLVSFIVTRQFDRKLSGSVEVRRNQGEGFFGSGGGRYRENAVTASLSYHL